MHHLCTCISSKHRSSVFSDLPNSDKYKHISIDAIYRNECLLLHIIYVHVLLVNMHDYTGIVIHVKYTLTNFMGGGGGRTRLTNGVI